MSKHLQPFKSWSNELWPIQHVKAESQARNSYECSAEIELLVHFVHLFILVFLFLIDN